ncbi:MAG: hypothetical protein Kow0099_05190 [Candidatus Abyssubacteria bacterium]
MSEPEAKQHVLDSIERCREALATLESVADSAIEKHKKGIEEVAQTLEGLKEKVFLKTKKATTPAYLVNESSQAVADLAEEASGGDEDAVRELGEAIGQLKEKVAALEAASKQHSVIVT